MTENLAPVEIPRRILEEVYREARKAFPWESCGWLAGSQDGNKAETVRPCVNAVMLGAGGTVPGGNAETAYQFTAQDAIALDRSFDTDTPAIVIYHSHPNGRAYFSQTDRQVAEGPWGDGPAYPVQHLVVGISQSGVHEAALFEWSEENADFAEIARYDGADI